MSMGIYIFSWETLKNALINLVTDIDVDQEVCPHCGAKVVVLEYPGGVGNKEREEIRCPQCHKVICERTTNGFFKTELMNS